MSNEIEKFVWKYLHNYILEALENGSSDNFMLSRSLDEITKTYKQKFLEFPDGTKIPIIESPTIILIKRLKKEKGINQNKLAIRLGVSKSQVSRWKTGREPIPKKRIKHIQSLFKEDIS